jgi:site-specific recombinase XerD
MRNDAEVTKPIESQLHGKKTKRELPRGIFEKIRGSKIYWIRFADSTGKIRREKAGSLGSANSLLAKRKTETLQGRKLPETLRIRQIRFDELAKDGLEYSKTNNAKGSYRVDEGRMEALKKEFGSRIADSITPQEIDRWMANTLSDRAPATLNRYRALLSLTYRVGIANRKVATNPARSIRQRRENNARIRWLRSGEETRLRTVLEKKYPHRLVELELALNTGLRQGEQYSLIWDNIDLERRILTVTKSKNGERRHIPLNDAALAALMSAKRYSNDGPAVFWNRYGERLRTPRQWFEEALEDAKISNFRWHDLRHTFASRLVMAGVDLRTVQQLMGHKTIGMTVRYAHLAPEHQLAAVQKLCPESQGAQPGATDTTSSTSTSEPRTVATTNVQ